VCDSNLKRLGNLQGDNYRWRIVTYLTCLSIIEAKIDMLTFMKP